MIKNDIIQFAQSSIVVLINDIMEIDIIIPRLIFDYNVNPNIKNGFYMYQNISGDTITLNMQSILSLKNSDDMKTVIVYGFIHEIMHLYQNICSKYKSNKDLYTNIEDTADMNTILYIRENKIIIEKRLNFKINDVFLNGIERQLKYKDSIINFNNHVYYTKAIAGALSNKLNINFDYLYNQFINSENYKIVFYNKKRTFWFNDYATIDELNTLINLIYLEDFKMIRVKYTERSAKCNISRVECILY